MRTRLLTLSLRLGLLASWLPAAVFWRFAALRAQLQTRLDHAVAEAAQPTSKP